MVRGHSWCRPSPGVSEHDNTTLVHSNHPTGRLHSKQMVSHFCIKHYT